MVNMMSVYEAQNTMRPGGHLQFLLPPELPCLIVFSMLLCALHIYYIYANESQVRHQQQNMLHQCFRTTANTARIAAFSQVVLPACQ